MRHAMRMYRTPALIALIALLSLALLACTSDRDDDSPAPTAAPSRARPIPAATAAPTAAPATATPAAAPTARPIAAPTAAPTAAPARPVDETPSRARPVATPAPTAAPEAPAAPAAQPPRDTTFRNYGRTPFVDAATDAVSTFSLDTDRTSYFLALNWARNGYEVQPDSVRAEEWINAFAYNYGAPPDDRSFAIRTDIFEHPLGEGRHIARIGLQAPKIPDDTPLNVTLVLDASGSMREGDRVAIAREAAETIRRSLGPRDRIAVVHFTTDVISSLTVEHRSPDDDAVSRSIDRLEPHGSTNVQAGLDLGVRLADAARRERPEAFNYIILMSDGVANVDATNPFVILESAPDHDSRNPLRLITIGVGIENYNDYLLEQLAQHGNGWYRYLDDTAQARSTFSRENWLALSTPFADQARAQVTWDPRQVQAWRIIGYENRVTPDHTFEQDRKEFAELPSGAATTVYYELVLRNSARFRSTVLGAVEVRWVEPGSGITLGQQLELAGRPDAPFDAADRHFRLGAIVGLAADRYSALSPQVEGAEVDIGGIYADLVKLLDEFYVLEEQLPSLQAYVDFRFLLEQLMASAAGLAPASGYSQ